MSAVFRVCLGEHHQFDVARVATDRAKIFDEVVDFIFCEGEAEFPVGAGQRIVPTNEHVHGAEGRGFSATEKCVCFVEATKDRLGHAIVQEGRDFLCGVDHVASDPVRDAAFESPYFGEPADVCDLGGLRRPR